MTDNVIPLPRPHGARTAHSPLAFFVRAGRNDHVELLDLLGVGEQGIFGVVIEAHNVDRHRALITEARRRNLDVVLDPKTQQMGLPGGLTGKLAELPWGLDRHHTVSDFKGTEGRARAAQIVEFAVNNGFTQLLGPSHLLNGPNDPWLRNDINMMVSVADEIAASNSELGLIYSLAVPIDVLRKPAERSAIVTALEDAPFDAAWLKIENFGDDASGEKTAAYIEACRDFHVRGVPIVGDHIGGLPGLAALAFGAVGGIAHGVTMQQNFRASNWRRPPKPSTGATPRRVYLPQLDMLLKSPVAKAFLNTSTRVRGHFGCRDTHCCPHGIRDMLDHPARHALYQRAREVEMLGSTPQSVRVDRYLDERVRRVSDDVASAAGLSNLDDVLQKKLSEKQRQVSKFRQTMSHLAESAPPQSIAIAPSRRATGKGHGS